MDNHSHHHLGTPLIVTRSSASSPPFAVRLQTPKGSGLKAAALKLIAQDTDHTFLTGSPREGRGGLSERVAVDQLKEDSSFSLDNEPSYKKQNDEPITVFRGLHRV